MKPPLKEFSCDGKQRHETKESAVLQMVAIKNRVGGGRPGLRMEAYKCRFCGGFHVGHGRKV